MKKLGEKPVVDASAKVTSCELGRYTEVGPRSMLLETHLDDYSYVVNDSDIAYTTIGKFCSIASHVRINPGQHPMSRASQSHFTYRASAYFDDATDEAEFFDWRRQSRVEIGHDVWIGHGAIILGGHRIGSGSVVGAGAVVTHDVPPYAIVVGNPARILRMRFPQSAIDALSKLAWWNWSHEVLRDALDDFRQLDAEFFALKYSHRLNQSLPAA